MSEWKECKLGDIVTIKHGWPFKSEFFIDSTTDKPIVIGIGNFNYLGGFRFSSTKLKSYIGDYPKEYELTPGDILLVMTCQTEGGEILGIPGIIPNDNRIYLHNQRLGKAVVTDSNLVDNKFLYWLFLTSDFNQHLVNSASGTKILHTSPSRIEEFQFLLPPLPEQIAVATVLSSFDDKINLLHHQNKVLEAMAETFFRHWLVEKVDQGWEKGKLGDYIQVIDNRGKTPPLSEAKTNFPVIEVNALTGNTRLINYSVIKKYVSEDIYRNWFRAGHPKIYDTLIATVGSVGEMAMFLNDIGTIAQNIVAFRATKTSPFYLYQYLKNLEKDIKEYDIGSVQPSIKVTHLVEMDFLQPNKNELIRFDSIVKCLTDKLMQNQSQIFTLEKLRDTLLPKLMSGEFRVEL